MQAGNVTPPTGKNLHPRSEGLRVSNSPPAIEKAETAPKPVTIPMLRCAADDRGTEPNSRDG